VTCDRLPDTGLGANVGLLLLIAVACVVTGVTTMHLGRREGSGTSAILLLALLLTSVTAGLTLGTDPAQAAASGCSVDSTSDDRLSVIQTSTMVGLAPGIAPAPITGRLVNISDESTHVTLVEVEITSITPRPGTSPGVCAASDYQLIAHRMPVGRSLQPGATTPFAGASVGFSNKTSNQDACQGATVHLRYTANPG
jgi:hypothetical protein